MLTSDVYNETGCFPILVPRTETRTKYIPQMRYKLPAVNTGAKHVIVW